MSELSIEHVRVCSSVIDFRREYQSETTGETYVTTYNRDNAGDYGCNWHCTCKGFKYRGKCSHVNDSLLTRCNYGSENLAGSHINEWDGDRCPRCGSETRVIAIGV